MGFLQRWLDEPDEAIAANAKRFYLATFVFMAVFAAQMVGIVWDTSRGPVAATAVIGPVVCVFLTLAMYVLAIDGRRSYKSAKAAREAIAPPDPNP
jgi:di/tricarboxylate transporter